MPNLTKKDLPLSIPAHLIDHNASIGDLSVAIGIAEQAFMADMWDGFPGEGRGRIEAALAHRIVILSEL